MYRVEHFAQTSSEVLHDYIIEHPFAALVVSTDRGPLVNHVPMEFDSAFGEKGRLIGHVARANPLWQTQASGSSMAVFCDDHAYVSPDWYESKREDPRVVPTWNYAAVHVIGRLTFFQDADRLADLLARLTDRFESNRPTPWKIRDAPRDFVEKMIRGVVGFELEIEQIEGKWKLSQNRSPQDQEGVRAGLRREGGAAGAALADLMDGTSREEDE